MAQALTQTQTNQQSDPLALNHLGALLHLVDPTLPIGGFNHSNGLETFIQQGRIKQAVELKEFLQTQLLQNWIYNDGAFLSLAFDAMQVNSLDKLIELDTLLGASKIARETREGSYKLGVRLLKIFSRYEQKELLKQYQQGIKTQQCKGYFPIAFAVVAQSMGLNKADTLYAFYYNAAVGAITNGVKLVPLSQMDGQDILFELRQPLVDAVEQSLTVDLDWLGAATLANDVRAMQHETLYSRLYMS